MTINPGISDPDTDKCSKGGESLGIKGCYTKAALISSFKKNVLIILFVHIYRVLHFKDISSFLRNTVHGLTKQECLENTQVE